MREREVEKKKALFLVLASLYKQKYFTLFETPCVFHIITCVSNVVKFFFKKKPSLSVLVAMVMVVLAVLYSTDQKMKLK